MVFINKIIIILIPFLPRYIIQIFSKKYVAGVNNSEALNVVKNLNKRGQNATIDILGEHTCDIQICKKITSNYIQLLEEINNKNLICNLSIKPSHIGADINYKTAFENFREILEAANRYDNFIRIDMENSELTDLSIRLYKELKLLSDNIGIVFQAYLHRTENDISNLPENSNIRLCKGIYKESEDIAYQKHDDINTNYMKILKTAFKKDIYIGIATHDKELIKGSLNLIEREKIESSKFEFQYLYGVPMEKYIRQYKSKNFKVRAYIPFGEDWYDYSIRRIKENPKIASYVLKNIFSKNNIN